VRVYFDTGVFIDYLGTRGSTNAILRSSGRRGRTPANMAVAAERLFETVGRAHTGATSCLTFYEVEEALYRLLAQIVKGCFKRQHAVDSGGAIDNDPGSNGDRPDFGNNPPSASADRLTDARHSSCRFTPRSDGDRVRRRSSKIACRDTDLSLQLL